jgi:dTDP-D-glucose 4,6-dehydratase
MIKDILITGKARIIVSDVFGLFKSKYSNQNINNLEALTNTGNLENFTDRQC